MQVDPITNITDLLMVAGGGGGMAFDPRTDHNNSAVGKQTSQVVSPKNDRTSLTPTTRSTTDGPSNHALKFFLPFNSVDATLIAFGIYIALSLV
jgi:hypothetical protein